MAMSKRLLAVSWVMPPLVFPRSLQISRLFKGLAARGWSIDVVTAHPDEVVGTRDERFAAIYDGCYDRVLIHTGESVEVTPLVQRVVRRLNPPADFSLDNFFRRGSREVMRRCESGNYDALVTFGQPWIDHLIGLAVKRRWPQLPWLAHFSDPWADSPYDAGARAAGAQKRALRDEAQVVAAADGVVFVSEETSALVMRKYGEAEAAKAAVLPHAYDVDLLDHVPPYPRSSDQLRLVYTGSFYPGMRMPDAVLRAVARLNATGNARDDLRLDFIGNTPANYPAMLGDMGLFGQVLFLGSVGYMTALSAAAAADALLLIDAPADVGVFLPSKIVDYLMFDKPILGITPLNGASARVLRECGHPVAAPDDDDAIYALLAGALKAWRGGTLGRDLNRTVRSRYDMHHVSAQFDGYLERICGA